MGPGQCRGARVHCRETGMRDAVSPRTDWFEAARMATAELEGVVVAVREILEAFARPQTVAWFAERERVLDGTSSLDEVKPTVGELHAVGLLALHSQRPHRWPQRRQGWRRTNTPIGCWGYRGQCDSRMETRHVRPWLGRGRACRGGALPTPGLRCPVPPELPWICER